MKTKIRGSVVLKAVPVTAPLSRKESQALSMFNKYGAVGMLNSAGLIIRHNKLCRIVKEQKVK